MAAQTITLSELIKGFNTLTKDEMQTAFKKAEVVSDENVGGFIKNIAKTAKTLKDNDDLKLLENLFPTLSDGLKKSIELNNELPDDIGSGIIAFTHVIKNMFENFKHINEMFVDDSAIETMSKSLSNVVKILDDDTNNIKKFGTKLLTMLSEMLKDAPHLKNMSNDINLKFNDIFKGITSAIELFSDTGKKKSDASSLNQKIGLALKNINKLTKNGVFASGLNDLITSLAKPLADIKPLTFEDPLNPGKTIIRHPLEFLNVVSDVITTVLDKVTGPGMRKKIIKANFGLLFMRKLQIGQTLRGLIDDVFTLKDEKNKKYDFDALNKSIKTIGEIPAHMVKMFENLTKVFKQVIKLATMVPIVLLASGFVRLGIANLSWILRGKKSNLKKDLNGKVYVGLNALLLSKDDTKDLNNIVDNIKSIFSDLTKIFRLVIALGTLAIPTIVSSGFVKLGIWSIHKIINGVVKLNEYTNRYEKTLNNTTIITDVFISLTKIFGVTVVLGMLAIPTIVSSGFVKLGIHSLTWLFKDSQIKGKTVFGLISLVDVGTQIYKDLSEAIQNVDTIFDKLTQIFKNVIKLGVVVIPTVISLPFIKLATDQIVKVINSLKSLTSLKLKDLNVAVIDVIRTFQFLQTLFVDVVKSAVSASFAIPSLLIVKLAIKELIWVLQDKKSGGLTQLLNVNYNTINEKLYEIINVFKKINKVFLKTIFVGILAPPAIVSLMFVSLYFKAFDKFLFPVLDRLQNLKKVSKKIETLEHMWKAITITMMFTILAGIFAIPAAIALVPVWLFFKALVLFLKFINKVEKDILTGVPIVIGLSGTMAVVGLAMAFFSKVTANLDFMPMIAAIGILVLIGGVATLLGLATTALAGAPAIGAGILVLLALTFPILGFGLQALAVAVKMWSMELVGVATMLFIGLMPPLLIMGTMGLMAAPGLIILGTSFIILSIGLTFLALAVWVWDKLNIADGLAELFAKIRLGVESLLTRPGVEASGVYNVPILGSYIQMIDSVLQSVAMIFIGVAMILLGVGLAILGASVLAWKKLKIAEGMADLMAKIRLGIEGLLERPNSLAKSGAYNVPVLGAYIQMVDSVLQSVGMILIGVAMLLLGIGMAILGVSVLMWKKLKLADDLADLMSKIRLGIEGLLTRTGDVAQGNVSNVPFFGPLLQAVDAILQSVGMIVIGVAMLILSIGMIFLGLAVMLWKKQDLAGDFPIIMENIKKGINMLLYGGKDGNVKDGTTGFAIFDSILNLANAVAQSMAIVLISVSLIILSLALIILSKAVEQWDDGKVVMFPKIMGAIREGIDMVLNGVSGGVANSGTTGIQVIDGLLNLVSAVSNSLSIIFISFSLIVLGKALEFLGQGLDAIGDKWKAFPDIMAKLRAGMDMLMAPPEKSDTGVLGTVAGWLVGSKTVDNLQSASLLAATSAGLLILGQALKVLGDGLSKFPENTLGILKAIGTGVKSMVDNFDAGKISDIIKPVMKLGDAFETLGNGMGQITYALSRTNWIEGDKSNILQFAEGLEKILGVSIDAASLTQIPPILEKIGDSLKVFGNGMGQITLALTRVKWAQNGLNPMLQFGDGINSIFEALGNKHLKDINVKHFVTIANQFVKFSKAAGGFKKFTSSFKEFAKDFKFFTETLNSIQVEKLDAWTGYNKINLEMIKTGKISDMQIYGEEVKKIVEAFFVELKARDEQNVPPPMENPPATPPPSVNNPTGGNTGTKQNGTSIDYEALAEAIAKKLRNGAAIPVTNKI